MTEGIRVVDNVAEVTGTVVVNEALNPVVDARLTLAVDGGLDAISLAVVWTVNVRLETVDILVDGTLTVCEDVGEIEVLLVAVVAVVLKPREDDDAEALVADVEVKLAAIEGAIPSTVVTSATDISVDTGVVDPRVGGPGVEREVNEETLTGNNVVEGIGTVVVVALTEALNSVVDARLTLAVDDSLDAISLAVVCATDDTLAMADIVIDGTLTVDEDAGEMEVPVVALVTEVLKPCEDDDDTLAAEVEVEFAAIEGTIPSAVVTSATDISADTGVVDLKVGGPGVEREVNAETLTGNNVVECTGKVVVVAVIEPLNSVVDT